MDYLSKICIKCKQSKSLDMFSIDSRNKKDGRQSYCKECNKSYKNIPEVRKANKLKSSSYSLLKKYGITQDQWYKMFNEQKGECKACHTHHTKLKRKLCVDHCHKTDIIRGLLCFRCNLILGNAEDSKELLLSLAAYL